MPGLYLLIDCCTIIVPFLFSFHPKIRFYEHFGSFFLSAFLVGSVFVAWDAKFTAMGVWGFNPHYLIGVNLFTLPIEEVLFFLCVPFSCLFTYHCLTQFFDCSMPEKNEKRITLVLTLILTVFAFYYHDRMYTLITFSALAVLLLFLAFVAPTDWLGALFKVYAVLLIPFFIVNGILTGTGIEEPIVWYNNDEIIGFRMLTIPVEDTFYGFLLILLNVYFYERFKMLSAFITL